MKKVILMAFCIWSISLQAQNNHYWNTAVTDQASAYPFSILAGYLKEPMHAGLDFGYGKILSDKQKHQWYREYHLGYFYHRFVQHGIPIYLQYGYKYKIIRHFSLESSLGAGYFHSIPATAVLKLNDFGEYETAKGIGRPQVMLAFNLGTNYQMVRNSKAPIEFYIHYQQRLQAPFVKSYVPILPYVQFSMGTRFSIHENKK